MTLCNRATVSVKEMRSKSQRVRPVRSPLLMNRLSPRSIRYSWFRVYAGKLKYGESGAGYLRLSTAKLSQAQSFFRSVNVESLARAEYGRGYVIAHSLMALNVTLIRRRTGSRVRSRPSPSIQQALDQKDGDSHAHSDHSSSDPHTSGQ